MDTHAENKGHSHLLSTYYVLGLMQGTDCWRLQEEVESPATSHNTRYYQCPHLIHVPQTELPDAGKRSDSSWVT